MRTEKIAYEYLNNRYSLVDEPNEGKLRFFGRRREF